MTKSTTVVLRATNIDLTTNLLDFSDLRYISDRIEVPASKLVRKGSLLICTASGSRSHLGKVALIDVDYGYAFGGFMGMLTPKESVDQRFLFHAMTSAAYTEFLDSLSGGTNINNLRFDDLGKFSVPLPPLPEQRRIVEILDEAFAAIAKAKANTERNLQNARAVFETVREATLWTEDTGWSTEPLSRLCEIKHGFAFKSEFFADSGELVLLTPGNFFEHGGYRDRGDKQKYYLGEVPPGFVLNAGDMLVVMTEQAAGLLGSPLIVPDSNTYLHNQRLGLVVPRPGAIWCGEYFFHVFNTHRVRRKLHQTGTGVKVRHTSPVKIGQVLVRFPRSANDQQRVAAQLNSLSNKSDRLADLCRERVSALDALKQSLLHHAFTGQLTAKTADRIMAMA